jgi:DNA mismatch endonuclease (patch repair protein)
MKKLKGDERRVGLGGGITAPYPSPTSKAASKMGGGNRRVDTKPEMAVRSALHKRGLRFRKDMGIRAGRLLVHPDVVFTRSKVAVFVDGCFWHCCSLHGTTPKSNIEYWSPKLAANKDRDRRVNKELQTHGWRVIRCWEHDDPEDVADQIERELRDDAGRGA